MNEYELLYRMRYHSYVDFAFRECYPDEYFYDNWHIELISELLQFMVLSDEEDKLTRAVFNLPPDHFKTHLCSTFLATWFLGRDPRKSVLILSENPGAAFELQERCADLMNRPRYRSLFPRAKIKSRGKKVEFAYGGCIQHTGIRYSNIRQKNDLVIIDNPQSLQTLDRLDPHTLVELPRLLKDPKRGLIVMNTRRLSAADMSYHLSNIPGWTNFTFPTIAPDNRQLLFPPHFHYDLDKGEPIEPVGRDWSEIEASLEELGWEHFLYQHMQGCYKLDLSNRSYRKMGEKDGFQWMQIGQLDETQIALREFKHLRELYFGEQAETT